jgi:hypothetical protein
MSCYLCWATHGNRAGTAESRGSLRLARGARAGPTGEVDSRSAVLRSGCRAGLRHGLPHPGRHPGGVPALASSRQFAGARAARLGIIGAAVLPTDPVSGYPPGTPDALSAPSRTGTVHNLAAVPVFFGLPVAAFICAWQSARIRQRGFGLYSAATAMTMLATTALAGAGFGQSPRWVNRAGLFQRASILAAFGWLTALSARALKRASAIQPRQNR